MNTPFGSPGQSGPRLDGYEIRTAAVRRGIPCVTTVQGLAAAVQGIEAITRGEVGVRSLQEHAARSAGRSARSVPRVSAAAVSMTHGDVEREAGPGPGPRDRADGPAGRTPTTR